jgi:hypothetical protein
MSSLLPWIICFALQYTCKLLTASLQAGQEYQVLAFLRMPQLLLQVVGKISSGKNHQMDLSWWFLFMVQSSRLIFGGRLSR